MPAPKQRKIPGPCSRCGQIIQRGSLFTWGGKKDGQTSSFHYPDCSSGSLPAPVPEDQTIPAVPATVPATVPAPEMLPANGGILGAIEAAITPAVYRIAREAFNLDEARAALLREAHELVSREVAAAMQSARVPVTLEIRRPDGSTKELTNTHRLMPRLLNYAKRRKPVYIYGLPGGGKTTAAEQVAEALGFRYGCISLNPQTPDWKLLGHPRTYKGKDDSDHVRPLFEEFYTNGGVWNIDELDNASAALLTTFNSAIANGFCMFADGLQQRHPDFVLICTGNTNGRGGDVLFPERRVFDTAFANRFRFLYWGYDEALEETLTMARNPHAGPWLRWTRTVRAFCAANKLRVFASPRASMEGAEDMRDASFTAAEVADSLVFQGVSEEIRSKVIAGCPLPVGMVQQ